MTSQKVHPYALNELKTTLDDHLPIYLSTSTTPSAAPLPKPQRFTPIHTHTYIRLALGYTAVAIAAYIFYLDYVLKVKFVDIKGITALAVLAYFILNGLLTLWLWFGERGLIFVGSRRGSGVSGTDELRIRSLPPHRKYDPTYRLQVAWTSAKTGSGNKELTVEFMRFFDGEGHLNHAAFESWVRQAIPVVAGSGAVSGTPKKNVKVAQEELEDSDTIVLGTPRQSENESPRRPGRPRKTDTPRA